MVEHTGVHDVFCVEFCNPSQSIPQDDFLAPERQSPGSLLNGMEEMLRIPLESQPLLLWVCVMQMADEATLVKVLVHTNNVVVVFRREITFFEHIAQAFGASRQGQLEKVKLECVIMLTMLGRWSDSGAPGVRSPSRGRSVVQRRRSSV